MSRYKVYELRLIDVFSQLVVYILGSIVLVFMMLVHLLIGEILVMSWWG
jgi:hypothetical protein